MVKAMDYIFNKYVPMYSPDITRKIEKMGMTRFDWVTLPLIIFFVLNTYSSKTVKDPNFKFGRHV